MYLYILHQECTINVENVSIYDKEEQIEFDFLNSSQSRGHIPFIPNISTTLENQSFM